MSAIPPADGDGGGYARKESVTAAAGGSPEAAQRLPVAASARLSPRVPLIARTHEDHEEHRQATWLELFFDLCFVVAVAALARAFHSDPDWPGALIYIGLFLPVWWAWMGFAWFSNTFDNDDVPYRAFVFGGMLAVIWLATSVEAAARGSAEAYALAYIALSTLLLGLMIRARRDAGRHPEDRWQRIISGYLSRYLTLQALGIALWVASFAFDDATRYVFWGLGLVAQMYGPMAGLRPYYDDEHTHDRMFHFDHIRERYGLLTIIVLGESVLAVSIGVSEVGWDASSMATASFAFLAAVSIWWTYFDRSGRDALSGSLNLAFIWGYGHFAIFAGIAAVGVGTELLIEASGPSEVVALAAAEPIVGGEAGSAPGPAVFAGGLVAFIAGMTLINLANLGFTVSRSGRAFIVLRIAVAVAVALVAWLASPSPLEFAAVAGGLMLLLNANETRMVMRLRRRQEGGPPAAGASLAAGSAGGSAVRVGDSHLPRGD